MTGSFQRGDAVQRKAPAPNATLGTTPKQHRLLQFLCERESQRLPAPSLDEMAAAVGLQARSGAHRLVVGLEERGLVRRMAARKRSVQVIYRAHPVADQLRDTLIAAVGALPEGSRLAPIEVIALIRETPLARQPGTAE
jgi:SOS-response transcriptional repressor LexA